MNQLLLFTLRLCGMNPLLLFTLRLFGMNQLLPFTLRLCGTVENIQNLPQITPFIEQLTGSTLFITDLNNNDHSVIYLRETANFVPIMLYDVKFPLKKVPTKIQKPHNVIIDLGSGKIAENVKFLHQNDLWDPRSKVLVLTDNHHGNTTKEWLRELWSQTRAVNVLILARTGHTFKMYTWFPYQPKECSNVTTITEIHARDDLFPEKVKSRNFNSCPLRIVAHSLPPFSAGIGNNFSLCIGVDVNVMRVYLAKFNLSPDFLFVPWTEFYLGQNGFTATRQPSGAIKMLFEGERDFGYGGIQAREEFTWYTQIIKYHFSDALVWFGPLPREISSIDKLSETFSTEIWILVTISYILLMATVAFEAFINSDFRSILHASGAFINASVTWPKGALMKSLFTLTFLFSLHITTFYQSSLIYLLGHHVTEPTMNSVDEALDRGFHLYAYQSMRHLFGPSWKYLEDDQLHYVYGKPDFKGILESRNGLFLNPRATTGHELRIRGVADAHGRPFTVEVGYFMAREIAMLATPGHPLIPLFEGTCQQLLEGGFTRLWYDQTQFKLKPLIVPNVKPFAVEDVVGIFQILFLAHMTSVCVFVVEYASRIKLFRNVVKTLKLQFHSKGLYLANKFRRKSKNTFEYLR